MDVAQDSIITEVDCGSEEGLEVGVIVDAGQIVASLGTRTLGRTAAQDVVNPKTGNVIVPKGRIIAEEDIDEIESCGLQTITVRSVLTCHSRNGVCAACYGRDLARGTEVNIGEAVGVIAAQSIGEPGTQLTMRTFHIGGTAQVVDSSFIESNYDGTIQIRNRNVARDSDGRLVALGRNLSIVIIDEEGNERSVNKLTYGSQLHVDEGDKVTRGQRLAEWDPYTRPVLSEVAGVVDFEDVAEGLSVTETTDESTGITKRVVIDWRGNPRSADLKPAITLKKADGSIFTLPRGGEARYLLSPESILSVQPGHKVSAGDVLARVPMESAKTKDITGGLPRVAELFEARRPKDHAVIADVDGTIRSVATTRTSAASFWSRMMNRSSRSSI